MACSAARLAQPTAAAGSPTGSAASAWWASSGAMSGSSASGSSRTATRWWIRARCAGVSTTSSVSRTRSWVKRSPTRPRGHSRRPSCTAGASSSSTASAERQAASATRVRSNSRPSTAATSSAARQGSGSPGPDGGAPRPGPRRGPPRDLLRIGQQSAQLSDEERVAPRFPGLDRGDDVGRRPGADVVGERLRDRGRVEAAQLKAQGVGQLREIGDSSSPDVVLAQLAWAVGDDE